MATDGISGWNELRTLRAEVSALKVQLAERDQLRADLDAARKEVEQLEDDVRDLLPRYWIDGPDGPEGFPEEANVRETIEYAGDEITRLKADNARLREALKYLAARSCSWDLWKQCGDQFRPGHDPRTERDQLRADLDAARKEVERTRRCLAFFRSVIKSGEPWTDTCEQEYAKALAGPGGE